MEMVYFLGHGMDSVPTIFSLSLVGHVSVEVVNHTTTLFSISDNCDTVSHKHQKPLFL